MKKLVPIYVAMLMAPALLQAAVITIYDGEQATFGDDLAAFGALQDLGDGTTYGVDNVAGPTPFASGDAMRLYDFNNGDKPDLQGELGTALTSAWRIDFQSLNQSAASSSSAIRFRMANTGLDVGSESRTAFSVSWQADGDIGAKYSGMGDSNPNDVDTKNTAPLSGVQNVTIVGNNELSAAYAYTLFGESRVLDAQHYDVFINGVLLNDGTDADFLNGMQYTLENSATDYDPTLGLQRFGLFGSGNSNVDPDVMFDNIILRTGIDIIPEPGTLGLVGLAGLGLMATRRFSRS